MPPLKSSHPVPARNPPTTGYGMNRTRLPSRKVPSTRKMTPHDNVTTSVAATTVRKTSGVSHLPTDAVWQILMMLMALVAVLRARIQHGRRGVLHAAHDAAPARPPRQEPERERGRDEVQADAVAQAGGVAPVNTRAANATARTTSTPPMITPAASFANHPCDRRPSDTVPPV